MSIAKYATGFDGSGIIGQLKIPPFQRYEDHCDYACNKLEY